MAKSYFNTDIENIKYASITNKRSVVTFSSADATNGEGSDIQMLVSSATLDMQRPSSIRRFLNADPALIVGMPSGTLSLQGLFGTAEQISTILGTPGDVCKLPKTITFQAGSLTTCHTGGTGIETSTDSSIVLYGCVCQGFNIEISVQENGVVYQQASASFVVTDAGTTTKPNNPSTTTPNNPGNGDIETDNTSPENVGH